jgi:hypothetical protein
MDFLTGVNMSAGEATSTIEGAGEVESSETVGNFLFGEEENSTGDENIDEQENENAEVSEDEEVIDDDENSVDGEEEEEEQEGDDQPEADSETLDPRLLVKLGSLGVSDEKIDKIVGLNSNAAIEQMIELLQDNKAAEEDGSDSNEQQESEQWFELDPELLDGLDEDLAGTLKGISESAKGAVEKANQQVLAVKEEFEGRWAMKNLDDFEDAIGGMDKEWTKVFGTDEAAKDQNSDAFKNRSKLFAEINSDKYTGSIRKRVEQASKIIFSENAEKVTNKNNAEKARNRKGQFLAKSDSGTGPDSRSDEQTLLASMQEKIARWTR